MSLIVETLPAPPTSPCAPQGGRAVLERWHVLHTKPRQEKALADVLGAAGIRHFLPCIRRVAYAGRRKRVAELPLFSSYVFLWGPLEAAYFAVATKRVVRAIPVADQTRLDDELTQIRTALEGGAALDPYPYLTRGRRARVASGPLRGLEGLVEERLRRDRLVLQVQTLGRATALEIDAALLEPVD